MVNIVVDAMGGDNAPSAVVKGCIDAAEKFDVKLTLVGDEEKISACLGSYSNDKISVVNATEVIDCDDDPVKSIRSKKDSSIVVGMRLVADKKADAFVSAGSTGAVVSGATLIIKRIPGVRRVAIGTVIPSENKPTLLLDCGANADSTSEYLGQFATMGTAYMKAVMGVSNPTVALLNNGAEEHKGSALYKESHSLLKKMSSINFIGNIEARYVLTGAADVVVADGFSGNVFLKAVEGTASMFSKKLKGALTKNIFTKLCALGLMGGISDMKKSFDYTEHGGAPVLGAKNVVIKAHGSSNAKAFCNAILQAKRFTENNVVDLIADNLQKPLDE